MRVGNLTIKGFLDSYIYPTPFNEIPDDVKGAIGSVIPPKINNKTMVELSPHLYL